MKQNHSLPLKITVALAMLTAISIVMGKYLQFGIGDVLRFSFENLPVIFAGIAFGPLAGGLVGAVADLIGCILVGYAINPIVTVGAVAIGVLSGTVYKLLSYLGMRSRALRVGLSTAAAHIIGSVIIKTFGLAMFYSMPVHILMLWRLLNYIIVGTLEALILILLMNNKMLSHQLNSMKSGKSSKEFSKTETKMNYDEALSYIHGISWTFCKPGLERISELCERLGNPQDSLRFVHVAGTNGKGSFCSMLSSILEKSGLKVGLYTSPYIYRFNERMRVNGKDISDSVLAEITSEVRPIADSMADKPTEFELITAIAFEYFKREKCDIVVLEAGMGGRLDSTNIIKAPLLSVITGIALDHTAFLGDTVEKIAAEKAGIIKNGAPILFGGCDESAKAVIHSTADERGSDFYQADYEQLTVKHADLGGTVLDYKEHGEIKINLLGLYQPRNAALVLEAVDILRGRCLDITDEAIRAGLETARWRARFEIIEREPTIIFDGAHNPEGIEAAVESIKHYYGEERVAVMTGMLRDKDYRAVAGKLSEIAKCAYTITPDNPRALSADEFAQVLLEFGVPASPCESISEALAKGIVYAKENGTALCCLGSLYTYIDVIKIIESEGK